MRYARIFAAAACAAALSGPVAHAFTVKLPHHVTVIPPSNGIVGTWLASYDGGVHQAVMQWQKGGTSSQIVDFAAKTGNALLGDWKTNGDGTVSVYLIGWSYDPKGNSLAGYFTKAETETVTGNSYSGSFEVTFYDLQGNILFQHEGTLTATRVGQ
jgi:hypothetical protein